MAVFTILQKMPSKMLITGADPAAMAATVRFLYNTVYYI